MGKENAAPRRVTLDLIEWKVGETKYRRQGGKTLWCASYFLGRRESLRRAALRTSKIMTTENNDIPPYQRLARSVTDGRECLSSYSVVLEKSDLKSSTALL